MAEVFLTELEGGTSAVVFQSWQILSSIHNLIKAKVQGKTTLLCPDGLQEKLNCLWVRYEKADRSLSGDGVLERVISYPQTIGDWLLWLDEKIKSMEPPDPTTPPLTIPCEQTEQNEGEKFYMCPKCGENFKGTEGLNIHIMEQARARFITTGKWPEKKKNCSTKAVSNLCIFCLGKFRSVKDLSRHKVNHHYLGDKKYSCSYCGKMFAYHSNRNQHILCVHLKIRPYQCPDCSWRFFLPSDLEFHIQRKHRNQQTNIKTHLNTKKHQPADTLRSSPSMTSAGKSR